MSLQRGCYGQLVVYLYSSHPIICSHGISVCFLTVLFVSNIEAIERSYELEDVQCITSSNYV